ncbi:MAG TPA: DegT/DnrJ/EryC1/StrS aminotransferase family protein [Steroidobacteraceae bacterium]|nr:DegT/DnrJ/EryC1/StrS aminotransferase family protein [Steroidobacteraceae bacterium]
MKPFLPFARPSIDEESIAAVAEVFRSGQLASGPKVQAFEAALAAYLGADRHVRVMTSATAGLEMALEVAGVGPGDEVIVPAMSFAASANVVARVGAKPVFVDIELESRNLDMQRVVPAITPRTRAIMPVHFSGLPVDMDALYGIARERGLRVVEDAAHAIGSRHRGRLIGSFGDLVVFSFHPNKNMTSIEGGAIATADAQAAALFEQYRFHGIKRNAAGEIDVMFPGAKSNLSDVAAQIGIDQLRRLDGFNARRRSLAQRYFEELDGFDGAVLPARGDAGHSWHMFQLLIDFAGRRMTRPQFQKRMAEHGIGIGVHYPCIPGLAYYRQQGYRPEDTPVAARVGRETVTLPLFPAMQDEDVPRVCRALREVLG